MLGRMLVRVVGLEGELPNVGSFTLPASMVAATGSVRILKTSPGNTTSFEAVPRARYRLTVAPPAVSAKMPSVRG